LIRKFVGTGKEEEIKEKKKEKGRCKLRGLLGAIRRGIKKASSRNRVREN
jgi:hypothetical protein